MVQSNIYIDSEKIQVKILKNAKSLNFAIIANQYMGNFVYFWQFFYLK